MKKKTKELIIKGIIYFYKLWKVLIFMSVGLLVISLTIIAINKFAWPLLILYYSISIISIIEILKLIINEE